MANRQDNPGDNSAGVPQKGNAGRRLKIGLSLSSRRPVLDDVATPNLGEMPHSIAYVDAGILAEEMGMAVFVIEHHSGLNPGPFSVLGAIAHATTSISLGCSFSYSGSLSPHVARHPSVVAKQASTLSRLSGRDVYLAMEVRGPSWRPAVQDAAAIIGSMWSPQPTKTSYVGQVFSVDGAPNLPRPNTRLMFAVEDDLDSWCYPDHIALQYAVQKGSDRHILQKKPTAWTDNANRPMPQHLVLREFFAEHDESQTPQLRIGSEWAEGLNLVISQLESIFPGIETTLLLSLSANLGSVLLREFIASAKEALG